MSDEAHGKIGRASGSKHTSAKVYTACREERPGTTNQACNLPSSAPLGWPSYIPKGQSHSSSISDFPVATVSLPQQDSSQRRATPSFSASAAFCYSICLSLSLSFSLLISLSHFLPPFSRSPCLPRSPFLPSSPFSPCSTILSEAPRIFHSFLLVLSHGSIWPISLT